MPTIAWDESLPSDSESAGLGDDRIRSLKSSVRVGLDSEHVWPAGGGDAGVHRLGSARPYVGLQSAVSSSGSDGRLMQTSDTSRLFHVGSGGTSLIGGPTVLSLGTYPGSVPQRHYWAMEFGEGRTGTSGQTVINFPNSGFSGVPFITATSINPDAATFTYCTIAGRSSISFTITVAANPNDPASLQSFTWMSVGSRVL